MTGEADHTSPAHRNTPDIQATVISDAQYDEAVRELANFLNTDPAEVSSLEILLKRIKYLGTDLRTVLYAGVNVGERPIAMSTVGFGEHSNETSFTIIARPDTVSIQTYTLHQGRSLISSNLSSIIIPVGDFTLSEDEAINKARLNAREGLRQYYPTFNPQDPEHNQGFARVLQTSLKQVIPYLPQRKPIAR